MSQKLNFKRTTSYIAFIVSVLMMLGSCTVKLVPDHDASMVNDITQVAKKVDKLYLEMLEIPKPEDRKYSPFSAKYVDIEVELNSLLLRNKAKPLNGNSTRINEIIIELFKKYKTKHQNEDKLSNGLIKNYRIFLGDAFNAMLVAEEGKKYGQPSELTND